MTNKSGREILANGVTIEWDDMTSEIRCHKERTLIKVICRCGGIRRVRPDQLRNYTGLCMSCSHRSDCYPTIDLELAGGTIFWSRRSGSKVPRICRVCGETRDVVASTTFLAVQGRWRHEFYACCDKHRFIVEAQVKLAKRHARGDQIMPNGTTILWTETYWKIWNRQNTMFVPVICQSGCWKRFEKNVRRLEYEDCTGFCHSCATPRLTGPNSPLFKPEGYIDKFGYRVISISPNDPYASMARPSRSRTQKGWRQIHEHRYVMAKHLGRCLEPWEQVDHIGPDPAIPDKSDNRIDNLKIELPSPHASRTTMQREIRKLRRELARAHSNTL